MGRIGRGVGCLATWLFAVGLAVGQAPVAKPVAVVNGEPISRAEFDSRWESFKKQRLPAVPVADDKAKLIQREILSGMMDEVLFKQYLKKSVPPADPAVVKQRLADFEKALRNRRQTLKDYCAEMNVTEARLREDLAIGVQWNAHVDRQVNEAELKRFYFENKALFDGMAVRASQIFVSAPRAADAKTHKEALRKIQGIRQEILAGLDFAAAARKHSQDASAANGGDLGYFPPTKVDQDPFMRVVVSLQPGEMSDVVQTDYGYHVIKLVERKEGTPTTFEQEKDNVRMLIADDMREKIVLEQRRTAQIEVYLP